ncbi:MAG: phosphatidylglycerophosphatase A family protein [Pyrinomonadaceae bacterium]
MTTIKESSDELGPPVSVPSDEVAPRTKRSATDYLALLIATCGVGYLPIAPGTLGALLGVLFYLLILDFGHRLLFAQVDRGAVNEAKVWMFETTIALVSVFLVTVVGIWAASRTEKTLQKKDPSIVVIDEVAGQMIALMSGALWVHTWWSVLSAFLLFRLFDIWKPYPIRRLESLESGLGIMADDVLAGVYALIVNSIVISIYLFATAR